MAEIPLILGPLDGKVVDIDRQRVEFYYAADPRRVEDPEVTEPRDPDHWLTYEVRGEYAVYLGTWAEVHG